MNAKKKVIWLVEVVKSLTPAQLVVILTAIGLGGGNAIYTKTSSDAESKEHLEMLEQVNQIYHLAISDSVKLKKLRSDFKKHNHGKGAPAMLDKESRVGVKEEKKRNVISRFWEWMKKDK